MVSPPPGSCVAVTQTILQDDRTDALSCAVGGKVKKECMEYSLDDLILPMDIPEPVGDVMSEGNDKPELDTWRVLIDGFHGNEPVLRPSAWPLAAAGDQFKFDDGVQPMMTDASPLMMSSGPSSKSSPAPFKGTKRAYRSKVGRRRPSCAPRL